MVQRRLTRERKAQRKSNLKTGRKRKIQMEMRRKTEENKSQRRKQQWDLDLQAVREKMTRSQS
jgi:hypothetical protein